MSTPPPVVTPAPSRRLHWFAFLTIVACLAVVARGPASDEDSDEADGIVTVSNDAGHVAAPATSPAAVAATQAAPDIEEPARALSTAPAPAGPITLTGSSDIQVVSRTFARPASQHVIVTVDAGDVRLVQGSAPEIRVDVAASPATAATLSWREIPRDDGSLAVEIRSRGDGGSSGLGILARLLSGRRGLLESRGVRSVRIELPPGVSVTVETGAGDIVGEALDAGVQVETGAGDVTLSRIAGDVRIDSDAGDVDVDEVGGSVDASTGAGDVDVDGARNAVEIHSGAGDVGISGTPGRSEVHTGVGDVRLRVASLRESAEIHTGMGEIDVTIASGGFEIDASTGVASVTIDSGGTTSQSSGVGGKVRRTIGAGGPTLELSSGGGSINVRTGGASGE